MASLLYFGYLLVIVVSAGIEVSLNSGLFGRPTGEGKFFYDLMFVMCKLL